MQTTRSGRTVKPTKAGAAYQNEIQEKRQRTEAKNKSTLSRVKKDVTKLAELQKVDQTVLSSNLTGVKEEVNNEQEENGLRMVVPPSPEPDVKDAMHEILENVVANEPNVQVIPFNQQGEYGEQIRNLTTFLSEVKVRTGVERLMIGDKTLEDMDHGGSAEYVKQKNGECDFLFDRFETLFDMIKEVKTSNTINLLDLDFFNLQDETQMNLHTILILLKGDYDIDSGNLNYYKYIFYAFYWNLYYNCYFKIDMHDTEIFNLEILKRFNDIFETYSITLPATMNNISVTENQIITQIPYNQDHMITFLASCRYINISLSVRNKEIKFKELLYYMPFSPNMPDPELMEACRTPRRMIQSNVISFYLDFLRIKYSQYLKDVYVSDVMIDFNTQEKQIGILKRKKFAEIPNKILSYKFVLIYFYSGYHFSLFILQKEDNGRIQPYHLDSMENGHTGSTFIQDYLNTMQTVINSQYSGEQSKKPSNIVRDKIIPNTIKQEGTNNCGLYVLDYMEEVFKAVSNDNFSIDTIVSRINDKTANNKRANIYDLYEQTKSSKLTKIVAQQPINLIGTPRYDEGSLLFDIVPLDLGTQEQDYTPPQEEEEERSPVVEDTGSTEEWVENEERKIKGIPPEFVEENETPPIIRKSTPQSRKDVPKKKSPPPKKHKSTSQSRKGVPSKANSKSTSRSQSDVQTSSSSSDDDDDYNSKKETRHRERLQVEFLPVEQTHIVDNNKYGHGQNAKIQEDVDIMKKVRKIDFSEEGYKIEIISSALYYNKLKRYIINEVQQSIKDANPAKITDKIAELRLEYEGYYTIPLRDIIKMIIDKLK